MKLNPFQLAKKLQPTIIIFIEYRLLMMLKLFMCLIIVSSVGIIKLQVFTTCSHVYLIFLESFCCPFHHLYAALLLHFINILAVVLCVFIPCFRAKSICRFATVYTGWLEQTRSNQIHIPIQSGSTWFGLIWYVFTLT